MNCKVSIIIVTWNSEEDIEKCIGSIVGARHAVPLPLQYEIIVVDNASKDNTVNIIKEKFPAVKIIANSNNLGLSKATNQAVKLTKGEYILLTNPDIIFLDNANVGTRHAVSLLCEFMDKDKTVGACAPQFVFPSGKIQSSCREFPTFKNIFLEFSGLWTPHLSSVLGYRVLASGEFTKTGWKMRSFDHNATREVAQPMGSCLLVRKTLFNEIGGMNERYPLFMNDVDLCYKIKKAGYKIYFVSSARVIHKLGGSTSKVRRKTILALHWSMYRYLKDHFENKVLVNLFGFLLLMSAFYRILFAPRPVRITSKKNLPA